MELALKRWLVVLGALVAAGLAGCGEDDKPAPVPPPVAPPAAGIVPQADIQGVPLDTPEERVLSRFGEPVGKPSNAKQNCLVYATDAGPDTWQRFCFVDGKLANIATVIGRETALTLDVESPKGTGKLRRPDSSRPK